MPLTRIKSLGITDGAIVGADINSTFDLTGKTVTLPSGTGGKVLQVIGATDSTQRSTTSSTFVTGSNTLSVSITPSSTSNKIAIFVSHKSFNSSSYGDYTIYRDSTNLGGTAGLVRFNSSGGAIDGSSAYNFLDSPATTSSKTYQVYMKATGGGTMYIGQNDQTAQIICMEIAG